MSSSSSGSLSSPNTPRTTESVVVVHQGSSPVKRRLSNLSPSSKKSLRRQICTVVHNLESVVSELNSVMHELHGVLEQIDRVTGCLDAKLQGRLVYIQHSTESETLWTTRRKRSFSSGCSLLSRNSKPSGSTSSSSSGSTDLSTLWKLPKENHSRSSSIGKQSQHRRNRKCNVHAARERRNHHGKTMNTENKMNSTLLYHALDVDRGRMEGEEMKLRDKKRNNNRTFLEEFCCIRTHSMYSAESEALRSCHSDDGTWVLRKGNGVISPIYPYARLPVGLPAGSKKKESAMLRSFSESNISCCSSMHRDETVAKLKLPEDRIGCLNQTPIKTSGIESLTDGSLRPDASSNFSHHFRIEKSLPLDNNEMRIPLMTYVKSPVDSARMHRDIFAETNGTEEDNQTHSFQRKLENPVSCNSKLWGGIYQYDSETEMSQKDATPPDEGGVKIVCIPGSDDSVGAALSEIEPDTVETDCEVEFSLMPTIAASPCGLSDTRNIQHQRDRSSLSLMQYDVSSLGGSFASLTELEEFKKRYRIDSYDSDANDSEFSEALSKKSKERQLVAEGLRLLLYSENSDPSGDIAEQKRKIMSEINNLKLSFSSALSSPDSDYVNISRCSPNGPVHMTPYSEANNLSDVFTLSSSGSNDDSPSSNGFHSDPEVEAFLQELDKKVLERDLELGSIDNVSVFSESKGTLSVTDAVLARKLTQSVLDENSNIKLNSVFRSSMDSVLTDDSNRHRSSDMDDSDHMMESFEWEHSFTFSMYQETGSKIPDFSPDADLTDKTLDSSFSQNFDLDEAMTYSLSYPLEKAKSASLSSGSFIWSEGSITSDRRLDSTGKSVDELLSELDISTDLLSKSDLKRPETLVPSLEKKTSDSLTKSEDTASDYKVGYNRDLNTWTAFAMVHIGGSDSNLSRCSVVSDAPSHASNKSNNLIFSKPNKPAATP